MAFLRMVVGVYAGEKLCLENEIVCIEIFETRRCVVVAATRVDRCKVPSSWLVINIGLMTS